MASHYVPRLMGSLTPELPPLAGAIQYADRELGDDYVRLGGCPRNSLSNLRVAMVLRPERL